MRLVMFLLFGALLVSCGNKESKGSGRGPTAEEENTEALQTAKNVSDTGVWLSRLAKEDPAGYMNLLRERNGCRVSELFDVMLVTHRLAQGTRLYCLQTENKNHMKDCQSASDRAMKIPPLLNELSQDCSSGTGNPEIAVELASNVAGLAYDLGLWPDNEQGTGSHPN